MGDEHEPARTPPVAPEPAVAPPADSPPAVPASAPAPEPAAPPEPDTTDRLKLYAKLLVLLIVGSYAIAFIVGNDRTISIDFVFATGRVSLIWTILLLLAVGLIAGALFSQLYRHRRSKKPGQQ